MSPDERKQLWQQRIESYRSSGESSVKAWCKQNQVGHQSMYKWMKKMQQAKNAFYFLPPSQVRSFLCLTPL
ncbi:IS66 family insertion sequence element accessory protein TnpA [Geobacillus thermodenitrificans]|jgi:nitrate/TMAO reductase-like tetraheme cytochrome c subunit|uniref:IS66 family insertion sequence element accessory protein TnpA n=1 Tax=Geobacillus thermodenitrificans TaxID=33940 RepID=UPI003AACEE78